MLFLIIIGRSPRLSTHTVCTLREEMGFSSSFQGTNELGTDAVPHPVSTRLKGYAQNLLRQASETLPWVPLCFGSLMSPKVSCVKDLVPRGCYWDTVEPLRGDLVGGL
jgi:hypothetical protein